jgi:hypothetical protein
MKDKIKYFILLFKKDYSFAGTLVSAILLTASIAFKSPFLGYLFFIFAFTSFDVLGFLRVLQAQDGVPRAAYRVVQTSFQIMLMLVIYLLFGWKLVLACFIAWWFTVCDLLFHPMAKVELPEGEINYLNWSVLGLVKLSGTVIDTEWFLLASVLGFCAGGAIALWM